MSVFVQCILLFGTAAVELWAAIPMGFAFQLNPVLIFAVSSLGAFSGSLAVLLLGAKIRDWLLKKHRPMENKDSKINRIWQKYGVIGLGLSAPLVTGALIATAIGLVLQADPKKLLLFITIGILCWTLIFTLIGYFGIEAFKMII